jgi:RNA polymerase sigma-70 factor (ECF subfamily)
MSTSPLAPNVAEALIAAYGFVPNLFRLQGLLPRALEAEARLLDVIQCCEGRLSSVRKRLLLETLVNASHNEYCQALYAQGSPGLNLQDDGLVTFALKLAHHAPWFSRNDVENLVISGFDDAAILEIIATTALSQLLCTLAEGLQPELDSELGPVNLRQIDPPPRLSAGWIETRGPYIGSPPEVGDCQPLAFLREQIGFIPNLFRAQTLRPDLVDVEVQALDRILFAEDLLTHIQKENISLVMSAANLNTYSVAVHSQIMNALGVSLEECDQIVENHRTAQLSAEDKALLDEVRKLSQPPGRSQAQFDKETLRRHGFTELQIIEAILMAGLSNFLNTLQFGLGTIPDFPPRRVFTPKDLYRGEGETRPTSHVIPAPDPDAELVAAVRGGEVDRFEELVRRHSRHIFSTLAGIVGNTEDAHDAMQEVFLKAFEKLGSFESRAKFSTWLMSIAINTGTEILRRRKPSDPLDISDDGNDFRPRQVQSWTADPEQLFSAAERDELVREAILRLPQKYRVALLLRDINQLSTEDAAAALSLSVSALKARVLRGRLMLRESLSPHFTRTVEGADD